MASNYGMGFANQIGGVELNFEAIPDLQPKAIRGIIKVQELPEENVLRMAIDTVPASDKLFKARIDDAITIGMTPEVGMNADDPMVGDTWRWRSDQVQDYRQAAKINREIGNQLLQPDGSPQHYAGQAELDRLMNRIVTYIDNRREYNRALSVVNAFDFDISRKANLSVTNVVTVVNASDQWDNQTRDVKGNMVCQPFNMIGDSANRLGFISGKIPNAVVMTPDVLTALENHTSAGLELRATDTPGARYKVRNLDVFVSQGRKNIGTTDAPIIVPLFQNMAIICSLDQDTIAEMQYDINRIEQSTTADQLFYYVRMWHSSKVHVSRPVNFSTSNQFLLTHTILRMLQACWMLHKIINK
jgi:hypothetical protein